MVKVIPFVLFFVLSQGCLPKKSVGVSSKVILGVPNWPSVRAKAHIFKIIIEENLGLPVELQTGSNAVIYEAMNKGVMHLHPEGWVPTHSNFIRKYVREAKSVRVSSAPPAVAKKGICVTESTAERTGIARVSDLTNPNMVKAFDKDGDGKGEMWIGAAGWGSTQIERVRAKSYGYDGTMNLKVMEEAMAMAELDFAVRKKQNIVFSCLYPHYSFVLYKLKMLQEPPHNAAKWKVFKAEEDPAWLEKSFAGMGWKNVEMNVYYAASLERTHPAAARFFSRANFSTEDTARMSLELAVNKVAPEDYARSWVSENKALVNSWLQ